VGGKRLRDRRGKISANPEEVWGAVIDVREEKKIALPGGGERWGVKRLTTQKTPNSKKRGRDLTGLRFPVWRQKKGVGDRELKEEGKVDYRGRGKQFVCTTPTLKAAGLSPGEGGRGFAPGGGQPLRKNKTVEKRTVVTPAER